MTGKDVARAIKQYKTDVEKVNPAGVFDRFASFEIEEAVYSRLLGEPDVPFYTFVRRDSLAGVMSSNTLGTDVLRALEAIVNDGHPIEFDRSEIHESADDSGEKVIIEVSGPPAFSWHREVGKYFDRFGVDVYSSSAD